jgi:hypothetical protein
MTNKVCLCPATLAKKVSNESPSRKMEYRHLHVCPIQLSRKFGGKWQCSAFMWACDSKFLFKPLPLLSLLSMVIWKLSSELELPSSSSVSPPPHALMACSMRNTSRSTLRCCRSARCRFIQLPNKACKSRRRRGGGGCCRGGVKFGVGVGLGACGRDRGRGRVCECGASRSSL